MRKYAARKRRSGTTTVLCWRRRLQRDRLYAAKAVGIVRENRFDAPVEQRAATVRLVDGVGKQAEPRRADLPGDRPRSEEHTSELQSLMRISYAVFCLKK